MSHSTELRVLLCSLFFAVVLAPAQSLAKDSSSAKPKAGKLKTHRFKLEDYRRRYLLYTPAAAKHSRNARPLVLVIHGGGSTDRRMVRLDKKRWIKLADQHNFYVAYPNAVNKLWDFGEDLISKNLDNRVNDLNYFRKVIDDISDRVQIDQSRIFATGISRGGQASYFLACNLPGRIRAIAPVAMPLPEFLKNECMSGSPVGVAVINGTADRQVPYEGGWITVLRKKRDIVMSTNDTIALWRNRNGCAATPSSTSVIDKPGDRTSVELTQWDNCSGAPVKLYKVNNGGHTWPSGRQYLPTRRVGETSKDISAADVGWAFFSQF